MQAYLLPKKITSTYLTSNNEAKVYSCADNYLHDYYNQDNNDKKQIVEIKSESANTHIIDKSSQLKEIENLLDKYKDLPREYRIYLIDKILSNNTQ